jgi:hypothetical protein
MALLYYSEYFVENVLGAFHPHIPRSLSLKTNPASTVHSYGKSPRGLRSLSRSVCGNIQESRYILPSVGILGFLDFSAESLLAESFLREPCYAWCAGL